MDDPNNNQKLSERVIRRLLHASFGACIAYYLFPPTIFGVQKWIYLIFIITIPTILLETWRLRESKTFFGLKHHEKYHLASYFWLANGTAILLIFFPQYIAAPCILACAIGDPLIGETRPFRRRVAFSVGILACFIIFILFRYSIILAAIASLAAFFAESISIQISWGFREDFFYSRSKRKVSKNKGLFDFFLIADDDFMMQIVPAIIIYVFVLFFTAQGWGWLVPPDHLIAPLKELSWIA